MNTAIQKNCINQNLDFENIQMSNNITEQIYTTSGKPLTINEYKNHLNTIMMLSDAGVKGFTTKEAKAKIVRQ